MRRLTCGGTLHASIQAVLDVARTALVLPPHDNQAQAHQSFPHSQHTAQPKYAPWLAHTTPRPQSDLSLGAGAGPLCHFFSFV